ncbi:MAG TPA: thioredoxin domain-containing protein [Verrucomicrobiae bacterium]|nr:thioredoxin domain-containing protein [Verrucomicrobiae bacterium]
MHSVTRVTLTLLSVAGLSACQPNVGNKTRTVTVSTNTPAAARHTNRLAQEKSPYLLQHAHNPVNWFAWGDEAFAKAKAENKPIFLSIGYSTCHWCHVMERESFEDETIGAYLNEHFVSIKVDREERPDVDKIYMTFVQSTTGSGGWPLNVFLTPDRKPFFGGTYFPPDNRYGRGSFRSVLEQIVNVWKERGAEVAASADEIHARLELATTSTNGGNILLTPEAVRRAGLMFKEAYDPQNGGFGNAPKFPQPSMPILLLRYAKRFNDDEAKQMVLTTCDKMAAGGIHDQLGGGFARYSVDAQWLVPHFEKMLYDNAQLAQLYLDAYLVSGDPRHAEVVRDILDYVLRDMTHPEGGFYSAEDADSEGHEGKFYCWTHDELAKLLSPEEFNVAARYFGITKEGNFVDHSHPQPLAGQNVLSIVQSNVPSADQALLDSAKKKMSEVRSKRIRPHLDDKILASWNGLMLGAFARAYAVLGDEKYRTSAEKNLAFIQAKLWVGSDGLRAVPKSNPSDGAAVERVPTGTLYHRWRDGERDNVQLLEAYAFQLDGVIQLYEATLSPRHLDFAIALAEAMIAKFYDPENGGFWQSAGSPDLILRVKDDYDGAEPSGNSVATLALLKLAFITDRADFRQPAEATLRLSSPRLEKIPQAMPYMILALEFSLEEPRRVVIAGDPQSIKARELAHAAHSLYQPNKVVLGNTGAVEEFARTLPAKDGPVVYLCTGKACQPPTSDPAQVRHLLR